MPRWVESVRSALEHDDPVGACRAYGNLGSILDSRDDAARYASEGVALARRHGLRSHEHSLLLKLALIEGERGRLDAAERCVEETARIEGPWTGWMHDVEGTRATLALCRGRFEEARRGFESFLARCRTEEQRRYAQRDLAVTWLAAGDPDAARAALPPDHAGPAARCDRGSRRGPRGRGRNRRCQAGGRRDGRARR